MKYKIHYEEASLRTDGVLVNPLPWRYDRYLILRSHLIDYVMNHRVTYIKDIKCHSPFLHALCNARVV